MNRKKGFTLIELLAVIVILAVIALIATPIIMNVINDSKKGAAKDSVYNYLDSITYSVYKTNNVIDFGASTFQIKSNGNLLDENNNEITIDSKGTRPTGGYITINSDGKIGVSMIMNSYCFVKPLTKDELIFYSDNSACNSNVTSNIVYNGYGELKDNTNFKSFIYNNDQSFATTSNTAIDLFSDDYMPINFYKKYSVSMDIKSSNPSATYYAGIAEYDIDKKLIGPYHVSYVPNTLTVLTKDLKDGDTVVYLSDTSNFVANADTSVYLRGLIFWNYQDSTGYQYAPLTYSRNIYSDLYDYENINRTTNTITLKKPWSRGTFKAGTKLSQSYTSGTYNYGLIQDLSVISSYKNYTYNITGSGIKNETVTNDRFRTATKYIRFIIRSNFNSSLNTTTNIRNIEIKEIK